ncbi:MAG: carbohydrate kinase family protein [Acutalibacteraceae bacterium]
MVGNKDFVAGIGSTNIDLLYSGLEKLPNEGEEIYSKNFSVELGGGVPATLINLSRLGISTKIATELSDEIFSSFATGQFKKYGVSPINLYKGKEMPLNVTSAMITPNDRTFISYGNGNVEATDEALEKVYKMCHGAKIVIMQTGGFLPIYKKIKEEGTVLVFDCGWDDGMSLETYQQYLELADYYTPNQKEAMKITDTDTPEKAAGVLAGYFEKVVVKLDKDGCLGMENGKTFVVPTVPDIECVDSTGAGDAFLSGFLYGLFYDKPFSDCILFGNITGGKCVTKVGCLGGYVTEKELLKQYQKLKDNR